MEKSDSGNKWQIVLAVALIGAISTITAAFIISTGYGIEGGATPGSATTPNTCLGPRAANVTASLADDVVIEIRCPPPDHSQYVLIAQPGDYDVDPKNPHAEYYLVWEMGRPAVGTHQRTGFKGYRDAGAEVTYYIISVDDTGFAQLQAWRESGNFVLELPPSHTIVSNRVTVKR